MSTIVPYTMHEAGRIPGIDGYFAAGQTVFVDVATYEVVRIESSETQQEVVPQNADLPSPAQDEQTVTGG